MEKIENYVEAYRQILIRCAENFFWAKIAELLRNHGGKQDETVLNLTYTEYVKDVNWSFGEYMKHSGFKLKNIRDYTNNIQNGAFPSPLETGIPDAVYVKNLVSSLTCPGKGKNRAKFH